MAVKLEEVLKLPIEKRLELVESIWDSIAESPESLKLTDSQRRELDRRLTNHEKVPDAGIAWKKLKDELMAE